MADVAHRFHDDTIPSLKTSFKEETKENVKKEKYKHISECKKFLELYQTYTI